jgi:hypothetical protein
MVNTEVYLTRRILTDRAPNSFSAEGPDCLSSMRNVLSRDFDWSASPSKDIGCSAEIKRCIYSRQRHHGVTSHCQYHNERQQRSSNNLVTRLRCKTSRDHCRAHGRLDDFRVLVSEMSPILTCSYQRSTLSDHGISPEEVARAFQTSARFFALDDSIKARTALNGKNAGWEKNAQIRPSTGTADQKESMQLQFARMEGLWPDEDDIPGFKAEAQYFMRKVQE